jgi:hypothetical protein
MFSGIWIIRGIDKANNFGIYFEKQNIIPKVAIISNRLQEVLVMQ